MRKIVRTAHVLGQEVELPVKGVSTDDLNVPPSWELVHVESESNPPLVFCYWLIPHQRWIIAPEDADAIRREAEAKVIADLS